MVDTYNSAITTGETSGLEKNNPKPRTIQFSTFNNIGVGGPGSAIYIQGQNVFVVGCYFNVSSDNSVGIDGGQFISIQNNIAINVQYFVLIDKKDGMIASHDISISNNVVNNAGRGIIVFGGVPEVYNVIISDNVFNRTTSDTTLEVRGGSNFAITDNVIARSQGVGLNFRGNYSVIQNNIIYASEAGGMTFYESSYNLVAGNSIHDNGAAGINYGGLYLTYSTNCTIADNIIYNSYSNYSRFGIYESIGSDYNTIIGNHLSNNRIFQLQSTGTHTNIHYNTGYITENHGFGTITGAINYVSLRMAVLQHRQISSLLEITQALDGAWSQLSVSMISLLISRISPERIFGGSTGMRRSEYESDRSEEQGFEPRNLRPSTDKCFASDHSRQLGECFGCSRHSYMGMAGELTHLQGLIIIAIGLYWFVFVDNSHSWLGWGSV
jgi:parallel beta-helix repeat protein